MPGINIFTSVLSLADRTLEKAFLDSGKLDLGLVSASSNGIEPYIGQSLCRQGDKLCTVFNFIQFVVYSMRNPEVYRTAKKVVFC